jgi:exopolysaccharide production protein ExoQ
LAESAMRGRPVFRFQVGLIGFLCFAAAAAPRLLPVLVGLLAVTGAIQILRIDPKRPLALLSTPVGIALGVFVAYLFVNASWAPDVDASYTKTASILGLVAAAFLIAAFFTLCTVDEARVLAKSALTGLLIGVAFLLIELAFDQPIKRFITNHIVALVDINQKKARVVDGEVILMSAFLLNRNVMSVTVLLIPVLLFTSVLARPARNVALAALALAGATCVLISASGTTVVALFLGAGVLALSALSLKTVRALLMIGWTIVVLFAIPLSVLPYELGWNRWTWVPPASVAARVYIWKHMADEAEKHLVTGIGLRGTRHLGVRLPADLKTLREEEPLANGRRVPHPHNIFLQVWLELGVIGAVIALGLGLAALWQIGTLPPLVQAGANGLFAVSATVGASGFELWQTWLFASYVFAWAAILLAKGLPVGSPARPKAAGN